MPNFTDRVIQGSGSRGVVGTYKAESLPIPHHYHTFAVGNGESQATQPDLGIPIASTFKTNDATGFSSPYSEGAPIQPLALCMNVLIKF